MKRWLLVTFLSTVILLSVFGLNGIGKKQGAAHSLETAPGTSLKGVGETGPSLTPDRQFGNLPLYFIPNNGQTGAQAKFYARTPGYTLWLTSEGMVFDRTVKKKNSLRQWSRDVSKCVFPGANPNPEMVPVELTAHRVFYLKGRSGTKHRGLNTSKAVLYKNIYNGIDLKVYGIEKKVEYDWVVKPGADPSTIAFQYKGIKHTCIDKMGNLEITSALGTWIHKKPVAFQLIDGKKKQVEAAFKIKKSSNNNLKNTYSIRVGKYDTQKPLIIDPVVTAFSSYLGGGGGDWIYSMALAPDGGVLVAGSTGSGDFPAAIGYQTTLNGPNDAFVSKIAANGSGIAFSTYFGGSEFEEAHGLAVDGSGAIYIGGQTMSSDLPVLNAYQSTLETGEFAMQDAFVAKLSADGSTLLYSTYLGGADGDDFFNGLAVNTSGEVFGCGRTYSTDFPIAGGVQSTSGGGSEIFAFRLSAGGDTLVYSTYLGGSGEDEPRSLALTGSGQAVIAGWTNSANFPVANAFQSASGGGENDGFVTKLSADGSSLVYSTYLGGSQGDMIEDVAVDSSGNAYVTGNTKSTNFPVTAGAYQSANSGASSGDAFVTKLNPAGSGLIFSTYLGEGSGYSTGYGIGTGPAGEVYVTGNTTAMEFPQDGMTKPEPFFPSCIFFSLFSADGSTLDYSTGLSMAWDAYPQDLLPGTAGSIYIAGGVMGNIQPVNPFQSMFNGTSDGFIIKMIPSAIDAITVTSPNGGEVWEPFSTQTITWIAPPSVQNVRIRFYNGWDIYTVIESTPNTGSYEWSVPYDLSEECKIYVEDVAGPPYWDDTDGYFSIPMPPPPSIEVTSPNGGEAWVAGSTQTITWNASGLMNDTVNIEYSTDNGIVWFPVAGPITNSGTYTWTVPNSTSPDCLVKVSDETGSVSDTGDAVFAITQPGIPQTERDALIALYNSTNGDAWTGNTNWRKPGDATQFNDPGTEHTWFGVTCNAEKTHVVQIDISFNNLVGSIPDMSALTELTSLKLNLDGYTVSSSAGWLGSLTKLTYLDVSTCNFNGTLPDLSGLTQLVHLNLGSNYFTGAIPSWLTGMTNLTYLSVWGNQLTGTLPPELANLTNLQNLSLGANQFTGTIPVEFGTFPALENLSINGAQLTGTIPAELGNISTLKYLNLESNNLTGSIPLALTSLTNLETLKLGDNDLTGSIPPQIGNLTLLTSLDMPRNRLDGPIPAELGNLTKLSLLHLERNRLTGAIPAELGNLTKLRMFDLSGNRLRGEIPSTLTALTDVLPAYLDIRWNALYTSDSTLKNFLDTHHYLWERTQTVIPINTSADGVTSNSVEISFVHGEYKVLDGGYRVYYTTTPGSNYTLGGSLVLTGSTGGTITVTDLDPGTDYYFYVVCYSDPHANNPSEIESDPGTEVSATTEAEGTITITAPNGGETWLNNSTQAITWTTTGTVGNVDIEYSPDNGATWVSIAQGTSGSGPYNWPVADIDSTECLIKITDPATGVSSQSAAVFTIAVPPGITVTAPDTSVTLNAGDNYTVTWTSTGSIANVKLEYSTDHGGNWTTITDSVPNTGSFAWTVPSVDSGRCMLRVSDATDPGVSDMGNSLFSIYRPASITVTSPNGGEFWETSSSQTITWDYTGNITEVKIEYSKDNGATWNLIGNAMASGKSMNWNVFTLRSQQCLIKITDNGNASVSDVSDAVFTSGETDSLTLHHPNGGNTLEAGTNYTIYWGSTGFIQNVKLEFSADNGSTWSIIQASVPNSGNYTWTVPNNPSSQCRVRVTDVDNASMSDTSNSNFTIEPARTITITSPNGGEVFYVGTIYNINWTYTGDVSYFTAQYTTDNGATWKNITQGFSPNTGTMNWMVPDDASTNCRVKIKYAYGDQNDVSDAVFTISQPPSITVTSPNGGEVWETGSSHPITWTNTGSVNNVKIEYSSNGGGYWSVITATTPNTGSYNWTVPGIPGTNYLVRVRDVDSAASDTGNAVFTVAEPKTVQLTSPNGGQKWYVGSQHPIQWTYTGLTEFKLEYSIDNGASWILITASTTNGGGRNWLIPDTPSTQCRVRISDAATGTVADISDGVFTIEPVPTMALTSPNGGETLSAGNIQNITWTSTGNIPGVHIEYSADSGASWNTVAASASDTGSFNWTVPSIDAASCLVRISDTNGMASDTGDGVFSIYRQPSITVTSPNGGESWKRYTTNTITWNTTGNIANVRIYYTKNGGDRWIQITGSTPNTGSYSWYIPRVNKNKTSCLVRVETTDGVTTDTSDSYFTILK